MTDQDKKIINYLGRCCIAALVRGDAIAAQECSQTAAYIARRSALGLPAPSLAQAARP